MDILSGMRYRESLKMIFKFKPDHKTGSAAIHMTEKGPSLGWLLGPWYFQRKLSFCQIDTISS